MFNTCPNELDDVHASKKSIVYFTFHLPYFVCLNNQLRYQNNNCFQRTPLKCFNCIVSDKTLKSHQKINRIVRYYGNSILLSEIIKSSTRLFYYADWFYEFLQNSQFSMSKFEKVDYLSKVDFPKSKVNFDIKKRVVFVGRIEKAKGLKLLCEALRDLDLDLTVYGNVVDQDYFEECKILYEFNFIGVIDRLELSDRLTDYDLLVLPSMFSEMSSMILNQAIIQGVPVLASDAHGNLEGLSKNSGKNLLFKYNDSEDLKNKLVMFYGDFKNKDIQAPSNIVDVNNHNPDSFVKYYAVPNKVKCLESPRISGILLD